MITSNKLDEFISCNACGKYTEQPNFEGSVKVEECGSVYDYLIGSIHVRFCKQCAKDMICALLEQVKENK